MVRHREKAEDHDRTATAHRQPKELDAGIFQAEISSFALHLAAGNNSAKTMRTFTEAVQWFAAAHVLRQASRDTGEQVDARDIQQLMSWLLDRYSSAYASNQYSALQPDPAPGAKFTETAPWIRDPAIQRQAFRAEMDKRRGCWRLAKTGMGQPP